MFGKISKFHCPSCGYNDVIEVGGTQLVNIKGKHQHLAVEHCPKCGHKIAFEIQEGRHPEWRMDIKISGNEDTIATIKDAVGNLYVEENIKSEEAIKDNVLLLLTEKYNQDFATRYYVEIIQLIELKLSALTAPVTFAVYDLSTIPNEDIENAGASF
jgi:predicted RNA-binding Zn-ribbon protein involved in translation (DUF1610 family)